MLLGAFEPVSKPWAMEGIPVGFEFDQLPEDFTYNELKEKYHINTKNQRILFCKLCFSFGFFTFKEHNFSKSLISIEDIFK